MKEIKRCCWRWSIATGVSFIGFFNLIQIVFIVTLYCVTEMYQYTSLVIFPIVSLYVFMKMTKKDGVKIRRRFYMISLISYCLQDAVEIYMIVDSRTELAEPGPCKSKICPWGAEPWFEIAITQICLDIIIQAYCLLILR